MQFEFLRNRQVCCSKGKSTFYHLSEPVMDLQHSGKGAERFSILFVESDNQLVKAESTEWYGSFSSIPKGGERQRAI
jgi:hypothetical protein